MDPRCTGRWGALATRPPSASNTAQLKSSRSLMFTEHGGVGERCAHLLGDGHEQAVEDLEQQGRDVLRVGRGTGGRRGPAQQQLAAAPAPRPASRAPPRSCSWLADDRRPLERRSAGGRSSRTYTGASCRRPPVKTRASSRGAGACRRLCPSGRRASPSRAAGRRWRRPPRAPPAPTASTATASSVSVAARHQEAVAGAGAARGTARPSPPAAPQGTGSETSVPAVLDVPAALDADVRVPASPGARARERAASSSSRAPRRPSPDRPPPPAAPRRCARAAHARRRAPCRRR